MDKLASPSGLAIDFDVKSRAKGKSSHVMVWRFAEAPRPLRLLHRNLPPPEWLVFVPHSLIGSDLDESITGRAESTGVSRYETTAGDLVYAGSASMNKVGRHLRTAKAGSAVSMFSHA
jgi:hypothetical protein